MTDLADEPGGTPPTKRPRSEAQLQALSKGREKARERRLARLGPGGDPLVATSAAEIREVQASRPVSLDDVARKRMESAGGEPQPHPDIARVARETKIYSPSRDVLPPPEDEPMLSDGVTEDALPPREHPEKPTSLADLVSIAPSLIDGQYYIEVTRKSPALFGGAVCKGLQPPIEEPLDVNGFIRRYGGGEYSLVLYGPPSRGGAIDPRTGRVLPKALTDPVKIDISPTVYPPNLQYFEGTEDEETEEEETMRPYSPQIGVSAMRRPVTTGDAKLAEVQFSAEDRREEREEQRRARHEREVREASERATREITPIIDVLSNSNREAVGAVERLAAAREEMAAREKLEIQERLDRALEESREYRRQLDEVIRQQHKKPTDVTEMMGGLAGVLSAVNPAGGAASESMTRALDQARQETQRLTTAHAAEIQRTQDKHAGEIQRITVDYRTELQRITDTNKNETERAVRAHQEELRRHEERLKENQARAEERANEAERRAELRVRDTEERVERRVAELREEHRKQMEDVRTQYTQRLDDERRQHDRDLKTQESTHKTRLEGQRDMYENRISTIQQELSRLQAEADRYRKEAEDNRDIGKQIAKAHATAEAIGWAPAGSEREESGPKDWKEVVSRVGSEVVSKFPDIVQSAGETLRNLRGGPQPNPAAVQADQYAQMMQGAQQTVPRQMAGVPLMRRDGTPFQATPLRFGTEDGNFVDPAVAPPRPLPDPIAMPGAAAAAAPFGTGMFAQPAAPPPPPPMQYAPVQYAAAPPPQAVTAPPTQMMMPAAPPGAAAPAPAHSAAGAPSPSPGLVIPSEMITTAAPQLEQALANGVPAAIVAGELVQTLVTQLGRDTAAAIVQALSPERIVQELQNAGRGSSPLVRRAGQKYLQEISQEAMRALGR